MIRTRSITYRGPWTSGWAFVMVGLVDMGHWMGEWVFERTQCLPNPVLDGERPLCSLGLSENVLSVVVGKHSECFNDVLHTLCTTYECLSISLHTCYTRSRIPPCLVLYARSFAPLGLSVVMPLVSFICHKLCDRAMLHICVECKRALARSMFVCCAPTIRQQQQRRRWPSRSHIIETTPSRASTVHEFGGKRRWRQRRQPEGTYEMEMEMNIQTHAQRSRDNARTVQFRVSVCMCFCGLAEKVNDAQRGRSPACQRKCNKPAMLEF